MQLEALKIAARLQTPVVGEHTLPLDSILFYCAMRDRYGVEVATGEEVAPVELPLLKRNEQSPWWYYAASFAQWPESYCENTDYWHKRFDLGLAHLIQDKKTKIKVDAFQYKAYRMPQFARHALHVDWYCVGDRREIERLLLLAQFIGKKSSQGCGAVLEWQVVPFADDWSERDSAGRLMRALPAEDGPLLGIRPSYYDNANQTTCLWRES